MRKRTRTLGLLALCLLILPAVASAQTRRGARSGGGEAEFGPNVRAYLGYLRTEQEVVDDRASRREIDRRYYIHNSNRIQALRQMALRIARESGNDYLPELEAVSQDEFVQFFETPPNPSELQPDGVLEYKFRYLGTVLTKGEKFYLFARLDPYEQAELRKRGEGRQQTPVNAEAQPAVNAASQPADGADTVVRPRRAVAPLNQTPPHP
ncbi:MAG TPA: hypothetical protein VN282_03490 [Pyrinomonadaceae bacterium]|nr:hypothetical protein [Pyrinomonadaceae bacterium]